MLALSPHKRLKKKIILVLSWPNLFYQPNGQLFISSSSNNKLINKSNKTKNPSQIQVFKALVKKVWILTNFKSYIIQSFCLLVHSQQRFLFVHLFFFFFLLDVHLLLAFSPLFLLLALFARSPVEGNKNKKIIFLKKKTSQALNCIYWKRGFSKLPCLTSQKMSSFAGLSVCSTKTPFK